MKIMGTTQADKRYRWIAFVIMAIVLLGVDILIFQEGYISAYQTETAGQIEWKVTQESALRRKISLPAGGCLRFRLASGSADYGEGYETFVEVMRTDGLIVQQWSIPNSENPGAEYYILSSKDLLQKETDYTVQITGNAPSEQNARSYILDTEGELWAAFDLELISRGVLITLAYIAELGILLALYCTVVCGWSQKPEQFFMFMSLVAGTGLILLIPLFAGLDEASQFARTYGILNGKLVVPGTGTVLTRWSDYEWTMYKPEDWLFLHRTLGDPGDWVETNTSNMAPYSPLSFLFVLPGVLLGKLWGDNLIAMMLLGRCSNLLLSSWMIAKGIQRMPRGKLLLAIASLLPGVLMQRTTISADGMTYAVILLLLADIVHAACIERFGKKDALRLGALLILTASLKVIYFVVVLTVVLLPNHIFRGKRRAYSYKLSVVFVSMFIGLGWAFYAKTRYIGLTQGGSNLNQKVLYCLEHPIQTVRLTWNTICKQGADWVMQAAGYPRPYVHDRLLILLILLLLVAAIVLELFCGGRPRTMILSVYGGIFALLMVLTFASLYLTFTEGNPEDITEISGIQGRYFPPIFLLMLIGLCSGMRNDTGRALRARRIENGMEMAMGFLLTVMLSGMMQA